MHVLVGCIGAGRYCAMLVPAAIANSSPANVHVLSRTGATSRRAALSIRCLIMILVWFCVVWLLGIVLGDRLHLPTVPAIALAGGFASIGVIWWPRRNLRMPLLLAATLLLGSARIAVAQPQTTAQSVWSYAGGRGRARRFCGRAARPPRRYAARRAGSAAHHRERRSEP